MVAKPKSANGAVAVGLPHRNRSVFKQTHINKRQVKGNDPSSAVDGLEGRKRIKDKISHGKTRNQISRSRGWKASERSERALFPEGRGLGVGRKKKNVKEKK